MCETIREDAELLRVAECLRRLDLEGSRLAAVFRSTLDQLYDGQRTGRYRWDQLYKTEKTHCGTLVEINLQREFRFTDGQKLDFQIEGTEVDCKYSQRLGGWMIPPESIGHLCMLAWSQDGPNPEWSIGLVRIRPDLLNAGTNRDAKATLNRDGCAAVHWLWRNRPMTPNVLLQLPEATVTRIMGMKHGTKRTDELFRSALGMIVGRAAVATVAQQEDYMKRVRTNGGSRSALRPEGIIILGQYSSHVQIARALGLPEPKHGEMVSAKVVPATSADEKAAHIGGSRWRLATDADPVCAAPVLPKI